MGGDFGASPYSIKGEKTLSGGRGRIAVNPDKPLLNAELLMGAIDPETHNEYDPLELAWSKERERSRALSEMSEEKLDAVMDEAVEDLCRAVNRLVLLESVRAKRVAAGYSRRMESGNAVADDWSKRCYIIPRIFFSGASLSVGWARMTNARGKLAATRKTISTPIVKTRPYSYSLARFGALPEWSKENIGEAEHAFTYVRRQYAILKKLRADVRTALQEMRRIRADRAADLGLDPAPMPRVETPSERDLDFPATDPRVPKSGSEKDE